MIPSQRIAEMMRNRLMATMTKAFLPTNGLGDVSALALQPGMQVAFDGTFLPSGAEEGTDYLVIACTWHEEPVEFVDSGLGYRIERGGNRWCTATLEPVNGHSPRFDTEIGEDACLSVNCPPDLAYASVVATVLEELGNLLSELGNAIEEDIPEMSRWLMAPLDSDR